MIKILESGKQYTKQQLNSLVCNIDPSVHLILIVTEKIKIDELQKVTIPSNVEIIDQQERDSILKKASLQVSIPFDDILQRILKDENYLLMRDRYMSAKDRKGFPKKMSNFHFQSLVAKKAYDVALSYQAFKPDYAIFASTPHTMPSWINCLVAEALNVKVILQHRTYLPGWNYIASGLGRTNNPIELSNNKVREKFINDVDAYVKKLKKTYDIAMPEYERKRLTRNKGKYFNTYYLLRKYILKPHWFKNVELCWRELSKLSKGLSEIKNKDYYILFIHYQPERTTLPEGYGYTQVLNIVYSLRTKLSQNTHLLVKEHPSTFTNNCNPNYRHPSFYSLIAEIEGVDWVKIGTDSFKLIDNALCAVTVTGTVAFESLIRGTPVINYGVPVFRNDYGYHNFKNEASLIQFIEDINLKKIDNEKIAASAIDNLKSISEFVIKDDDNSGRLGKLNALTSLSKTSFIN